jgi:hypothetical protein
MISIELRSSRWIDERWFVIAHIDDCHGTRITPHLIDLPESATTQDLIAYLTPLYS